jgi:hypothetical protein
MGGPETPVGDDPKLMRVDKHHSLVFILNLARLAEAAQSD